MPITSNALGQELNRLAERRLEAQRWTVDGMRLACTFTVGIAAAIDASAWQVAQTAGQAVVAAFLLAASGLLLIVMWLVASLDEPDTDSILEMARVAGLPDEQTADLLVAQVMIAAKSNRMNVLVATWLGGLSAIAAIALNRPGFLGGS
ncbi:hypothetical protein [Krasilnikoviella flava]|uniref:Uncharacterized protein n=1 Tax=Krasilnikoviella flava TaxID=526729 RepID=A0A1T5LNV4_9MICO|nr:hypothetical protein [Krasilnikoviella flava]SKC77656.1 hypothetical protein SAMN04324258_3643 [Krasilnikoviella flava]